MRLFTGNRTRPLRFVYAPEFRYSGTTVMRGEQLSELARSTSLAARPISFEPVDAGFRNSDLLLTKGAIKRVDAEQLQRWRRRGNRLFVDPVDEDLPDDIAVSAHVIVAASRSAAEAYRARWPRSDVKLLNHHIDPRVIDAMRGVSPHYVELRCAYFGEKINTVSTPDISRVVDFVQVDTERQDADWLRRLADYNFHYAVRETRELDQYKPFLKGFTAAACHANVLIQRGQEEAERWLPEDYPFWLPKQPTEVAILEAIREASELFGGPEWEYGLIAMSELLLKTSPRAVATEMVKLFE